MTRYLALVLLTLAASVLATGCGGNKGDNNGNGDKTGTPDAAAGTDTTPSDSGSPTDTGSDADTSADTDTNGAADSGPTEKKGGPLRGLGRALLKGASDTLSGDSTE
jgi:hypothetical protein